MPVRPIWLLLPLIFFGREAIGQAPESADLWRVAAASLAVPPALQTGPLGTSWNPAAGSDGPGLFAAVQAVQTSDIVGLSGVLAGLSRSIGGRAAIGAVIGRMDVRDLVRTTTSPNSEGGSIPVYTQFGGIAGRVGIAALRIGGLLRLHNARLDAFQESGLTLDLGVRIKVAPRVTVAAASHFLPVDMSGNETTDYYAGIEYEFASGASIGGMSARIVGRYGTTYRASQDLEHSVGGGVTLGSRFHVDASVTRESAHGSHGWRPGLAISFRIGRYRVGIARSSGLNDLGATYRIGLDMAILR